MELGTVWGRQQSRRRALTNIAVATAGVSSLALVGCGDDDDDHGSPSPGSTNAPAIATPQPKAGGTLTHQLPGNPPTFDVFKGSSVFSTNPADLVYSKLYRYKVQTPLDLTLEPDLATQIEQPDGLTYTFKLRPAKFQDKSPVNGRPLTADDVVYAINRFATDPASPHRTYYFWMDSIKKTAPDTVVIRANQPYADSLYMVAQFFGAFIVPRELAESDRAATDMVGSGPFMLDQFQSGSSITFSRNPNYHRPPYPYVDTVKAFIVTDAAKQLADFSAGNALISGVQSPTAKKQFLDANKNATAQEWEGTSGHVHFREDAAPFRDSRMRQAVSMCFDRKLIDGIFNEGLGRPDTMVFVGSDGWAKQVTELGPSAKFWEHNLSEAKKLMAAAAYDGSELEFTGVSDLTFGQTALDLGTLLMAQMREAGFKVKDVRMPYPQWVDFQNGVPYGHNYKHLGWFGAVTGAPPFYMDWIYTYLGYPGGTYARLNMSLVNDPTLQTLLDKQRTQLVTAERQETFRAIQARTADQQHYAKLSTSSTSIILSPKVRDYVPFPNQTLHGDPKAWLSA